MRTKHISYGHHWSNNPNNAHKVCTICGAKMDKYTINKQYIIKYTDKYGNELKECPKCINLL